MLMPGLVYIGGGRKTHLRADGSGVVPVGRARCEVTNDGKAWIYQDTSGTDSQTRPAAPGEPTCHWCRNRKVLG